MKRATFYNRDRFPLSKLHKPISIASRFVKAYLHLAAETALAQAAEADDLRSAGEDNALLGIPLAIKDMITLEGMPATAASRILEGFMPPYDATAVQRLRERGAVFLGKTNTD